MYTPDGSRNTEVKKCIRVTDKNLFEYLGKEKYRPDKANKHPEVGVVRGLAWTSVGGETLEIEVNVMAGSSELKRCYEGISYDCLFSCQVTYYEW